MQVAELNVFGGEAEGVVAVFGSLEVHGQFTLSLGINHSVILTILRDVDLSVVWIELELLKAFAFTEIEDGYIRYTIAAGYTQIQTLCERRIAKTLR